MAVDGGDIEVGRTLSNTRTDFYLWCRCSRGGSRLGRTAGRWGSWLEVASEVGACATAVEVGDPGVPAAAVEGVVGLADGTELRTGDVDPSGVDLRGVVPVGSAIGISVGEVDGPEVDEGMKVAVAVGGVGADVDSDPLPQAITSKKARDGMT